MWIELQDLEGNFLDEFEIEDDLFDKLVFLAEQENKPVEELLLEAITSYSQKVLGNESDEA